MTTLRVLIVDNQRSVRRSLRAGLESMGQDFEILEATSGEEAMLDFADSPVDLLVTAVRLAGMSGVELLQRMRQQLPELKGIFTAVNPDTRTGQLALRANANALVPKPIEMHNFLEAVNRCLARKPERGVQAKREAAAPVSLPERLAAMHQKIGAAAVILLDERGQILAQVGESEKSGQVLSQTPVLLEALGASTRLSSALGESIPNDLLCWSGAGIEILAAHVGGLKPLVCIFDAGVVGYTRARSVRLVSEAVLELASFLPLLEGTQRPVRGEPENPPESRPVNEAEASADLDAVFQQASRISFDPQEVDGFWDSAVDQPDSQAGTGSDVISFDQALDRGIVQDE